MARPREFDEHAALDRAIGVFREHGFEGTSAQMLVDAMGIGRQSLYDTFGDKWQLYRAAVRRYGTAECAAHVQALGRGPDAIAGIEAMLARVVETAAQPCLGVGATCEFGTGRPDLAEINAALGAGLRTAVIERVREAQQQADVSTGFTPECAADFLIATIGSIRLAGRGGADPATLAGLAAMALRALR